MEVCREEEEEDQREWDGDEAAGEPLSGQAASPRCLTGGGGGGVTSGSVCWTDERVESPQDSILLTKVVFTFEY